LGVPFALLLVQNKANSRQPGHGLGIGVPSYPSALPIDCAKQTQFPAAGKKRQVLGRKGVMVNRTVYGSRQNKANLAITGRCPVGRGLGDEGRGARCAKRSQFRGRSGRTRAGERGPSDVVQTNPIPATMPIGRSAFPGGRNVQNEPNTSIADCGSGTDLRRDAARATRRLRPAHAGCTNKPNSRSQSCETKPIRPGSSGESWRGHQDDRTLAIYAGGDGGGSVAGGRVLPESGILCHHRGRCVQQYCL